MLSLDVAISTYQAEGIKRVEKMLPSPQEGVRYIVSWQQHANAPVPHSIENRNDVEVYRFDLEGLSNNRNNSLDKCRGDIVLIADDDVEFDKGFSDKIRRSFIDNPDVDLGVFKVKFTKEKVYPESNCRLGIPLPKNYYCSSIEIAFRRENLSSLKFWAKMGLGNYYFQCGEDELFLISAIKRGLRCMFFNEEIAVHPSDSTGNKVNDGILRGQGYIIGLIYPLSSIFRIPIKALRISRTKKIAFFPTLFQLGTGAWNSIFKWKNIPESSRW